MITEYLVEQINVSDDEYSLVEMCCESGDFVKKNHAVFSYESSKSIHEVAAVDDGYFYFNPSCRLEQNFSVGFKVALHSPEKLSLDDLKLHFEQVDKDSSPVVDKLKISKRAKKLIDTHKINISVFSDFEIISEKVVIDYLDKNAPKINNLRTFSGKNSQESYFETGKVRLAVVGAGKAALQFWDALSSTDDFEVIRFYDSDVENSNRSLFGIDICRGDVVENITKDFSNNEFDKCIISFSGATKARASIFLELKDKGVPFANILHSTAYVSKFSRLGEGNLIFANSRIGPFCDLGDNNLLSASCSIEHNNIIGSHNTFGPGVLFSGSVTVGNGNKFGTMIGIEPNVIIGSDNIIASSQVVNISLADRKLLRPKVVSEVKDLDL